MPPTVYVLGLAIFGLGTSEFLVAGLLPPIAADLGVTIPAAGLLISAYAIGMLAGAPVLAIATQRLPRKVTLAGTLTVFTLGHIVGALAPGYAVLFVSRAVSAVACAGFWAAATATAVALVPAERRGRALAVVAGGLTVATVLGVPAGTLLGQYAGWRTAFWAVAGVSALSLALVLAVVPATSGGRPRLRTELGAYRSRRLWLALAITAITTCAVMVAFSYISPLLTDAVGVPGAWVPAVLALYGLGSLAGIAAGGRIADTHPFRALVAGNVVVIVALGVLAAAPPVPVGVIAAAVLGFAAFFSNPALNTRVYALAESAPSLAGATNVSAFNLGIVVAPWLGGLTIGAGLGFRSVTWLGIALAVASLAALGWAAALEFHPTRGETRDRADNDHSANALGTPCRS
ncbi:MAG TPA: Cmx/CmrA family chloramphenicol efflux MFS transporter [Amycolatopsis sp.]|nr:Cmx/CmrA family chloramphenicol efflux MFS transporter [Amycolatopsis sp.]